MIIVISNMIVYMIYIYTYLLSPYQWTYLWEYCIITVYGGFNDLLYIW